MTVAELTLTGTPTERGHAHGETLRDEVAGSIDRWFAHLAGRVDPDAFVDDVYHRSGLRAPVEQHTPDLLAEVRAIAEAAHQRVEAIFAFQLIDECWWYLDRAGEACSALAINHGGTGFVAQTQDLYRHFDGGHVLLRHLDPDGLEVLMPSVAGLLGFNGVNSAGLAMGITTLSQLPTSTGGLSTGFVVPTLARCRTIDAALDWLETTPLASGNSWLLGTRQRSVVVEASATGFQVVADGRRGIHTNHTLGLTAERDYVRFESSTQRLQQLDATVRADSTLAELVAMYATGAVCQSRDSDRDVISVGTMLFELGDRTRCHYAPGPLDTDHLTTFDFTTLREDV